MGILNATPDSFADGGEHFTYPDAVDHGLRLIAEGADIIDVGGESTRPGAERISPFEEERRVINVISKLADADLTIKDDDREIERMFGKMEDSTEVCVRNSIVIRNNISAIHSSATEAMCQDNYDMGF